MLSEGPESGMQVLEERRGCLLLGVEAAEVRRIRLASGSNSVSNASVHQWHGTAPLNSSLESHTDGRALIRGEDVEAGSGLRRSVRPPTVSQLIKTAHTYSHNRSKSLHTMAVTAARRLPRIPMLVHPHSLDACQACTQAPAQSGDKRTYPELHRPPGRPHNQKAPRILA